MNAEIKEHIADINSGIIPEGYKKTKIGIVPVEWEECHFKKMFSRLKRKNTENNTNVLTISAQYGLINQEEFFNKSVASDDKSNYYLLYKGDFAYNKSYSNGYPFGAIKALEKYEKGVVSPLYICFSPTAENKCPDYYLQYFESGNMNREIQAIAQEGARNHGLLNIGIDDFFNSYLVVPPLPEQQKIAEILSTQDKLIELQEKKIEQLKELKKAYLQKMFPKKGSKYPELRFKGFTDPWEQRKFSEGVSEIGDGLHGTPSYCDNGSVYFINGNNLVDGKIVINSETKTVDEFQKSMADKSLDNNTILMSINGTIGNLAYYSGENLMLGKSAAYIKVSIFDKKFVYAYLQAPSVQGYFMDSLTGTTIKNLGLKAIREMQLVVPQVVAEQQKIGSYFAKLDTLITLHQRKSEQEKQKKKALMQLLLTGIVRTK